MQGHSSTGARHPKKVHMSPSCQQQSALGCLQLGFLSQLVAAWPWSGIDLSGLLPSKAEGVKSGGGGVVIFYPV